MQVAGDRLELARTLCELGETHRLLGDGTQAAMASRRAWQLAKECGSEPLCARIGIEHGEEGWEQLGHGRVEDEAAPSGRPSSATPRSGSPRWPPAATPTATSPPGSTSR
ncbi:hypothetical protein NKH77_11920 [Streptomyces sp. M19]